VVDRFRGEASERLEHVRKTKLSGRLVASTFRVDECNGSPLNKIFQVKNFKE